MFSTKEKRCDNTSRACVVYLRQNFKELVPCERKVQSALISTKSSASKPITAYHAHTYSTSGKNLIEKHSPAMSEDAVNNKKGSKIESESKSISNEGTNRKESGIAPIGESSSPADENDNKKISPVVHLLEKYKSCNKLREHETDFIQMKNTKLQPLKYISDNQENLIHRREENIDNSLVASHTNDVIQFTEDGNLTTQNSRAVCFYDAHQHMKTIGKEPHYKPNGESMHERNSSFYPKIIPDSVQAVGKRGRPPKLIKSELGISDMSHAVLKKKNGGQKIKVLRPVCYQNYFVKQDNPCVCEERNILSNEVKKSLSTEKVESLENKLSYIEDNRNKQHLIHVMFDLPNNFLDFVLEYCGFDVFETMLVVRHLQSMGPLANLPSSYKLVKQHLTICRKSNDPCQCWFGMIEKNRNSKSYENNLGLNDARNVPSALERVVPVSEGNNGEKFTEDSISDVIVHSDAIQSEVPFGSVFRESLELTWGFLYGSYVIEDFDLSREFTSY